MPQHASLRGVVTPATQHCGLGFRVKGSTLTPEIHGLGRGVVQKSNKLPPVKSLNIGIPFMIPTKGRGSIHQGSGSGYRGLK